MDEIKKSKEIFTKQVKPIHPAKYFLISVGEFFKKIGLWVFGFVTSIFLALWNLILTIGKFFYKGALAIYHFFRRKAHQFKYNDKFGRLSFIFFGSSSLKHGQLVNGIMYIIFEVGYIVLFAIYGVGCVGKLSTLGDTLPHYEPDPFDPMFEQLVLGDNSVLVLVYGLLWVISLGLFVYIWNRSINSGYANYRIMNFKKFEKYDVDAMELSEKIDKEAKQAYADKVKIKDFKLSKKAEIDAYVSSIEDKEQKEYSDYLLYGVIGHSYEYCKKLEKAELVIEKAKAKKEKYVSAQELKLKELEEKCALMVKAVKDADASEEEIKNVEEKAEAKYEIFKNNVMIKTNKLDAIIDKKINLKDEIVKCYSHYVLMQHTINNDKFGKFNEFYKVVAANNLELTFYEHYFDLKTIYESSLDKAPEQNEKNAKELERLLQEYQEKVAKTNATFDEIVKKKADLKAQINEAKRVYNEKVAEIKKGEASNREELLAAAKLEIVEKSTRLVYAYNDLPSDKNIKALRKEEINESKNSYVRDKKYLKTNLTGETFGREQVINTMLLEYNIDYVNANRFVGILLDKKLGFKSESEVNEIIASIKEQNASYQANHEDKYVGKPKTFKEQVKSLFNENFHISLLLFPILGILLVSIVPLFFSILIAFTNYSKGNEPPTQLFTWIGFENFVKLFNPAADSIYKDLPASLAATLSWTIIWAVAATFSNYILGIIVALMINKESIKLKKLWRTVFVMTIAVPQFVSLLSMRALLADNGPIDVFMQNIGAGALHFANNDSVPMTKLIIILVNIWIGIPYTILSTTGILLNIPKDLYESARVDGAGIVKQFTKITMPYILFVTGPYLITQFVGNINNFNVIYFLSQGRPTMIGNALGVGRTDLLITFLYSLITSNSNPQYGIAATVGIVIFIICAFFSLVMYNRSGAVKEEDQFQ